MVKVTNLYCRYTSTGKLTVGGTLAVDPGGTFVGLAYWETPSAGGSIHPSLVAYIKAQFPRGTAYEVRAAAIAEVVREQASNLNPKLLVLELPQVFPRGGAAAMATGTVGKLSLLSGMIAGACLDYVREVVWVRPTEWKGQLPKETCARRVARALGYDEIPWKPLDCMDACGIGLCVLGVSI